MKPSSGVPFAFLILIYGIIAVIFGASDLASALSLTEASYQEMIDLVSEMLGMDASGYFPAWSDGMPLMMSLSALFMLISGLLAIVCYFFCRKADNWKLTTILCAASTVAVLGMCCYSSYLTLSIILFVIGVLMTFMVYSRRGAFRG